MADVTVTALNWMSGIKDEALIRDLSIPGTHDSCSLYGGGLSQCQWLMIPEQLNRGIRFLDIRCVYAEAMAVGMPFQQLPDDDFFIFHGELSEMMMFSSVQEQCVQFLMDNPTETILMNVQRDVAGPFINGSADAFEDQFIRAIAPYAGHWSFPSWSGSDVWTLDRCRGQIILIRAGGSDGWPGSKLPGGSGLEWRGYEIDGTSEDAHFKTQNHWTTTLSFDEANQAKVDAVAQYLDLAAEGTTGADKIYLNFLSRAAGGYVGTAAQWINDYVVKYLESGMSNTTGRLGTLPIDFVGNTGWQRCLEDRIIRRNPFKDGYAFTYAIVHFKLELNLPGGSRRWWMSIGQDDWAIAVDPGADPLVLTRATTVDGVDVFKVHTEDKYLSVSSGGRVGLYSSGTTFYEQQHGLVSRYADKPLRMKPDNELWCGDEGERVEVTFVPA